MKEILPLTGLRFFLAVWVVFRHLFHVYSGASSNFIGIDPGSAHDVFARGYLGVDGFFVLSGFVLVLNYGNKFSGIFGGNYADFMISRFARVYPVHFTVTMMFVLMVFVARARGIEFGAGNDYGIYSLVCNLFLVHSWYTVDRASWNDVSWSVSSEWFAYLLFPAFLAGSRLLSGIPGHLVKIALLFLCLNLVEALSGSHLYIVGGVARITVEFMIGAVVCNLYSDCRARDFLPPAWVLPAGAAFFGAGLYVSLDSLVVLGFATVIFYFAFGVGTFSKIFGTRAFVYGGKVSYSIYMVQRVIEKIVIVFRSEVVPGLSPWVYLGLYFMILFIGAAMMFHFVEEPCRRWIVGMRHRRVASAMIG